MDDLEILSDEHGTTLHMARDLPAVRHSSRRHCSDSTLADLVDFRRQAEVELSIARRTSSEHQVRTWAASGRR